MSSTQVGLRCAKLNICLLFEVCSVIEFFLPRVLQLCELLKIFSILIKYLSTLGSKNISTKTKTISKIHN